MVFHETFKDLARCILIFSIFFSSFSEIFLLFTDLITHLACLLIFFSSLVLDFFDLGFCDLRILALKVGFRGELLV